MNMHPQQDVVALTRFREKVTMARRQAGRLQKELAAALGVDAETLSRKLHGRHQSILTLYDVKEIIKTLASWQAITTQQEAFDLLGLLHLSAQIFSPEEWESVPLSRLEPATCCTTVVSATTGMHPVRPAARTTSLLPMPMTSLIGREQDVRGITQRLRLPEVRLLALVGPGGVGKTRLAVEVARALQASIPHGVYFVALSSLQDPILLPSRLLEAVGSLEETDETFLMGKQRDALDQLSVALADRECLLVLDTFEHLLAAATVITELLAVAPGLKVLVTSRAVLQIYGEHTWEVPPLELVDPRHVLDLATLEHCPAIRLFVERAQAIKPTFVLTEHNGPILAALCSLLDGLPLAIELAAARIKLFSPGVLLRQLEGKSNSSTHRGESSVQALTLLRQRACNVPVRQQTLWETLDWSYQLLDRSEQHLLAQLGVFQGGWTVEAARAICLTEPDLHEEMLDRLEGLVNQSLVVLHPAEEDGAVEEPPGRFSLLNIVHGYALAHLSESREIRQVQQRHAEYYLTIAERSEPDLYGVEGQRAAMRLLEREQDNIAAALAFALEQKDAEIAQRFCSSLFLFWGRHAQAEEGLHWLEAAMQLGGEIPLSRRSKLLLAQGWLLLQRRAYEQARLALLESLALCQQDDEQVTRTFLRPFILHVLGESCYLREEFTQAASYFEACLQTFQANGEQEKVAMVLARLGAIYLLQGDECRAEDMLRESVKLLRAIGQRTKSYIALAELSNLEWSQGKLINALGHMREALVMMQDIGYRPTVRPTIPLTLMECASCLGGLGELEQALRIGGAAQAQLERMEMELPLIYYRRYAARLEALKALSVEPQSAVWWAEGRELSQEQAIQLALEASLQILSH